MMMMMLVYDCKMATASNPDQLQVISHHHCHHHHWPAPGRKSSLISWKSSSSSCFSGNWKQHFEFSVLLSRPHAVHHHSDRPPRWWRRIVMGRSNVQLFRTTTLTEALAVLASIQHVKSNSWIWWYLMCLFLSLLRIKWNVSMTMALQLMMILSRLTMMNMNHGCHSCCYDQS